MKISKVAASRIITKWLTRDGLLMTARKVAANARAPIELRLALELGVDSIKLSSAQEAMMAHMFACLLTNWEPKASGFARIDKLKDKIYHLIRQGKFMTTSISVK